MTMRIGTRTDEIDLVFNNIANAIDLDSLCQNSFKP